jgi:hypothetical protein
MIELKVCAMQRACGQQPIQHPAIRITLDLDDGVKVNYGKFGDLLEEVKAIFRLNYCHADYRSAIYPNSFI